MTPYFDDGGVQLYLGDCLEQTAWLEADVLVTDPPYGISYTSGGMGGTAVRTVHGDADLDLRDAVLERWGARPAVVFGTWRRPRPARTVQRLVWHKQRTPPAWTAAAYYSAEEEIYLLGGGWQGKPTQNVLVTREWRSGAGGIVVATGHPTAKPVDLMQTLVAKSPDGVIADPFAGSGSTLIAARNLGRRAIGVEIREDYCERIASILSQGALFDGIEW